MDVAGCCNFQLRDGLVELYIPQVLRSKWEDWRRDWVYLDVSPHDRLTLLEMAVEPHRPTWEVDPVEDERMRPVLNRIDDLRREVLTSVMVVADYLRRRLAPLQVRARPSWMYTGPNDITRTHIGEDRNLEEGALVTLLRVMTSIEDLTWAVLPREQLALCADPGRVALQATLPEFDAQGLVDRPGCWNPGTIQIPEVDKETGDA